MGSIPSKAWAFGSYGQKINRAIELRNTHRTLRIVQEADFMAALAETPAAGDGEIDCKVVVATAKWFDDSPNDFDMKGAEHAFDGLAAEGWHVSATMCELALVTELYEELEESGGWMTEARLVRQVPLDVDELAIRQSIEDRFLPLKGVDPRVTAFARREGSAGYLRLLLKVPQRLRIE